MQGSVAHRGVVTRKIVAIPNADPGEHKDADEREQGKPDDLSAINDDRRGEEWSEGAAGISAYLED